MFKCLHCIIFRKGVFPVFIANKTLFFCSVGVDSGIQLGPLLICYVSFGCPLFLSHIPSILTLLDEEPFIIPWKQWETFLLEKCNRYCFLRFIVQHFEFADQQASFWSWYIHVWLQCYLHKYPTECNSLWYKHLMLIKTLFF